VCVTGVCNRRLSKTRASTRAPAHSIIFRRFYDDATSVERARPYRNMKWYRTSFVCVYRYAGQPSKARHESSVVYYDGERFPQSPSRHAIILYWFAMYIICTRCTRYIYKLYYNRLCVYIIYIYYHVINILLYYSKYHIESCMGSEFGFLQRA